MQKNYEQNTSAGCNYQPHPTQLYAQSYAHSLPPQPPSYDQATHVHNSPQLESTAATQVVIIQRKFQSSKLFVAFLYVVIHYRTRASCSGTRSLLYKLSPLSRTEADTRRVCAKCAHTLHGGAALYSGVSDGICIYFWLIICGLILSDCFHLFHVALQALVLCVFTLLRHKLHECESLLRELQPIRRRL